MRRTLNYFVGMLFSRMSIFAYGIGSSITTVFFYALLLADFMSFETRLVENLPAVIELYLRVAIPLWVPPITSIDASVFLVNCTFALMRLLHWTANYRSATKRRRGRMFWNPQSSYIETLEIVNLRRSRLYVKRCCIYFAVLHIPVFTIMLTKTIE